MPILTTCIGAYPKPDYLALPDWFNSPEGVDTGNPTELWQKAFDALGDDAEQILQRAVEDVVAQQIAAGIDIPTDGEVPRENYIHYQCRHIEGIDFSTLTNKVLRDGAYEANLPTIVMPVKARAPFLYKDWQRAQKCAEKLGKKSVKITLPGPMTMGDTTADNYYDNPSKRGADLANAINSEVLALAKAGCQHIQIDEPVFARYPDDALAFGFENLERAFHGCPASVTRTVHMCCGYPASLDDENYPKADHNVYFAMADAIEQSSIDAISLEDAHRYNDLSLLEHFVTTTVIFGAVAIAKSKVESVEEIRARLLLALEHIDAERLIAAPDCGLGLLGWTLAREKLNNLCEAARLV
jgi:5-methyltetrahydropteroyltriglutamate--homocysteine methyltransferase